MLHSNRSWGRGLPQVPSLSLSLSLLDRFLLFGFHPVFLWPKLDPFGSIWILEFPAGFCLAFLLIPWFICCFPFWCLFSSPVVATATMHAAYPKVLGFKASQLLDRGLSPSFLRCLFRSSGSDLDTEKGIRWHGKIQGFTLQPFPQAFGHSLPVIAFFEAEPKSGGTATTGLPPAPEFEAKIQHGSADCPMDIRPECTANINHCTMFFQCHWPLQ